MSASEGSEEMMTLGVSVCPGVTGEYELRYDG